MAVQAVDGSKKESVILPATAEVEIDQIPDGEHPPNCMIDVRWNGDVVSLFLVDLLERGERMDDAKRPSLGSVSP